MHAELEKLIHLQRAESQLRQVEIELAELPRSKAELEARLQEERARLDAAKVGLGASQKARRQYESELVDLESKRSRYKGQLMEVKTNKEYTAMLHEIEGVEREIRGREDQVLAEMEKAESLAAEIKREELEFKAVEQRFKSEGKALDERALALRAELERLGAERDQVAASVPHELLDLFHRVAKLRGSAVAEAKDAMCQLCHVKLRLQMFSELKKNEAIVQCPSCNRILYYEPSVPTVAPQP
jgi:predicted  nucleic acid-binding Zn-ribbon protein